jgi:hypothetical protein
MNTQYRQYEVNYLPWAPFDWDYIGGELRLGKVVFRPFSDDALRGIDERVADYLRLYFSRYCDLYNAPVNTITLCHYDPEHRGLLEPMSDAQQAEFAGIIDALTFCCIWGELREALNRGWRLLPPPNAETLECRAHRFSPDVLADPPMVTLVTHGLWHTEQVDKIFFQIPLPAHHRGKIQPNLELLELLNQVFNDSFDPQLRERLLRSLRWFRVAHRQAQALDAEIQIVEICTALEVLLNLPDRGKRNAFVRAVEQWITTTEGEEDVVRVEESANQQRSSLTTKAGLWAQNFYELRNAIVHEGIQSDDALVYAMVVTPLSSDDAYRSETLPNSKYGRSNLSPSQDSYADNDAQTNNPQHAHANTDANATSCAQTHTIPQPHPTNTPASQTHASCASNSSDDPAAPRSTAPREPHTDTLSATPTHNAPPHPPPCPDNDA